MNKLDNCYDIGSKIIDKYNELKKIIFSNDTDNTKFNDCIKELKELLNEEYIAYSLLDSKDMVYDEISKIISLEDSELTDIQNRFSFKLLEIPLDNILVTSNYSLCLSELLLSSEIPSYMKFNLDDILCYMFESMTILNIEKELYNLDESKNIDDKFLNELRMLHNKYKFEYFTRRSSFEIIALYHNFDINRFPKIDYSTLVKKLSEKYHHTNKYMNNYLQDKFVEKIKIIISNLSNIINIYADSDTYYQYMLQIELLNSYIYYLDSEHLDLILDYIDNAKFSNNDVMKNILIKKKK